MRNIKKILCLSAIIIMFGAISAYADITGEVLYTDIGALIDDSPIESYNINSERANEPEDPTEPTQPTEPGKQPNTGSYLSLIAVLWLAMFGMVFISCRKTMFKKI